MPATTAPGRHPAMREAVFGKKKGNPELNGSSIPQGYFYQGGQGGIAPPPLNFDNPKRSKIVYVTCGTIIRRVVVVARCKSSVIDF